MFNDKKRLSFLNIHVDLVTTFIVQSVYLFGKIKEHICLLELNVY